MIINRRHFLAAATAVAMAPKISGFAQSGAHSSLEFSSPDIHLAESFRWAKQQAMSYVFDNDPVGPWYEAALPGRYAFCMRDVSHQADGAQVLGLARYNHNMLRRFAENISASKDWCSYWEIDRSNRPAPVDYKNDAEFWYNLPANFDILDTCYRMYLWTGDRSYIDDPVFLNFYDRTMTDYITRWDLSPDRIMKRKSDIPPPPFFRGDPTYEESSRDNLVGVDLLATQYAAYRAYAAIKAIRGDTQAAQLSWRNALQMKSLINTVWWNSSEGYFYSLYDKGHRFKGRAGSDLLYRDAAEDGPKAVSALHTLLAQIKTEPSTAVEAKSHYAEVLYRYGDASAAYAQIMDLTREGRERREYPEVSYSVLGALVTGLMGIRVAPVLKLEAVVQGKPFETVVETLPQLTGETSWAELCNLPVQGNIICVQHKGRQRTKLTNKTGRALRWKAAFPGSSAVLIVDGKSTKAQSESTSLGRRVSWVNLQVPAGHAIEVKVS